MITTEFLETRRDVALFVLDLLKSLERDCVSITITRPEKSGGYYVTSATEESLDDIETQNFLDQRTST